SAQKTRPAQGQRQAQPHAAGRHVGVSPTLEGVENRAPFARGNTRAAVLDFEDEVAFVSEGAYPETFVLGAAAVLAGVIDEVTKDLLHQLNVGDKAEVRAQGVLDHQLFLDILTAPLPGGTHLFKKFPRGDARQLQPRPLVFQAREVQYVADES